MKKSAGLYPLGMLIPHLKLREETIEQWSIIHGVLVNALSEETRELHSGAKVNSLPFRQEHYPGKEGWAEVQLNLHDSLGEHGIDVRRRLVNGA